MNASRLDPRLRRLACAGLLVFPLAALAHPSRVETLDAAAWSRLQQSEKGPSAVVFSTTDCAHCPGVIAQLSGHIRAQKSHARLIVVVMDGAGPELLRHEAYLPADRLFVFDPATPPAALRHAVDPRWRGVTPYVVLMKPAAPAVAQAGPPPAELLQRWLGEAGGSAAGLARP